MRRIVVMMIAAALCAAGSAGAETQTYVGFQIGISNAPPPPRTVFVSQPRCEGIHDSPVYVVEQPNPDYDIFRYGSVYYLYNGRYWYRAKGYRGRFAVVDVRYVPRPVLVVPANHWRHHPHGGPPGQARKYEAARVNSERPRHGHH